MGSSNDITANIELLNEIKQLRESADPIKQLLNQLPHTLSTLNDHVLKIEEDIRELKMDVHGSKEQPSINYRLSKLQDNASTIPSIKVLVDDVNRRIIALENYQSERLKAAAAIKKTTVDTIIKTAVPWIIALLGGGYALYVGAFGG